MFCRCCLHHACIPNRREHVRLYLGQIPRVFVCHHPWPGPLLFVPRANASQARPLAGSWRQKTDSRLVRCQITIQSTLGRMKKHMPNSDTDTKTGRTLHHFFFGGGTNVCFTPDRSSRTQPGHRRTTLAQRCIPSPTDTNDTPPGISLCEQDSGPWTWMILARRMTDDFKSTNVTERQPTCKRIFGAGTIIVYPEIK